MLFYFFVFVFVFFGPPKKVAPEMCLMNRSQFKRKLTSKEIIK